MPEASPAGSKPSSSVKLVLLGEAAVGKVRMILESLFFTYIPQ
jgi:Ras-related protein Rab-5C